MRKIIYCCLINICLIFLVGCGKVELYPKDIEIEVGNAAPEDILDYVIVESDRQADIKDKARLDLSNIDVMNVGEYIAKITYGGKEVTVPVSVVDTTAPVIKVKERVFREGDQVIASDLAEVIDYSDVTLSILWDPEGMELNYETLRPGTSVVLKAEDQYGNETIEEVSLNVIPKENPPFPEERSYEGLEKFPYKDLQYVSDEVYEEIKSAYSKVEWYNELKTEKNEQNTFYLEKYKQLLDGEVTFLKTDRYTYSEVSERLYLSEFFNMEEGYAPEELFGNEYGQYGLYLLDMDSDNAPELCIEERAGLAIRGYHIFKYRTDIDEIVLWKTLHSSGTKILGSGIIGVDWEDQHFVYEKLNQSGETDVLICFVRDYFYSSGDVTYLVSLPQYQGTKQQFDISDEMIKQGYYDKSQDFVFFCVTEEQFQELFEGFSISYYKKAEENMEKVSYTYDELFGE